MIFFDFRFESLFGERMGGVSYDTWGCYDGIEWIDGGYITDIGLITVAAVLYT